MKKLFLVLLSTHMLALSFHAKAAELWSPELRRWALNNYDLPMKHPAVATTWAAMRNRLFSILGLDEQGDRSVGTEFRSVKISQERLASGKVPYLKGTKQSSKVIIILPGIFTGFDGSKPKKLIRVFAKRGYQGIYFPNPLSDDFILQKPRILPGAIFEEGGIFYEAILEMIQDGTIPQGSSIEIFGESYGAILGAALMKIDHERLGLFNRATLISPSLDMAASEDLLDYNINRNQILRIPITLHSFDIFFKYAFAKKESNLPLIGWASVASSRAVVFVLGFQNWLKAAAKTWERVFGLRTRINPGLNFSIFDRDLVDPVMPSQERRLLKLEDVMAELKEFKKIRVLSTVDDVINPIGTFKKNASNAFNDENLILLNRGGHLGFSSIPWYQDFLDRAFR